MKATFRRLRWFHVFRSWVVQAATDDGTPVWATEQKGWTARLREAHVFDSKSAAMTRCAWHARLGVT